MNKIIYTLGFLLVFSIFNNEVKAQTSGDVSACTKNASGAVVITAKYPLLQIKLVMGKVQQL